MESTMRLSAIILLTISNQKSAYVLLYFLSISMDNMHFPCAKYWEYVGYFIEPPLHNHCLIIISTCIFDMTLTTDHRSQRCCPSRLITPTMPLPAQAVAQNRQDRTGRMHFSKHPLPLRPLGGAAADTATVKYIR